MAELIIQNPSITTSVFEYDDAGRVSAISGHPLAGEGGGEIVKSDLMWKPTVGVDGYVRWTLASSATEPDAAYISGAQGPAGVDGKSLSAEYEEDSANRQTQVKIGQINGSEQTLFYLPWGVNGTNGTNGQNGTSLSAKSSSIEGGNRIEIWEKGASERDAYIDVMNGVDGTSISASATKIDKTTTVSLFNPDNPQQVIDTFTVLDGEDGDNGDPGYAPIVTTKTVTGQGYNNSGTEVTITYGEAGAQTAVYTAWNGNDGAGATVTLTGGEGIEVSQAGTNYTIALSATIPTSVAELSDSANYYTVNQTSSNNQLATEFEKYIRSVLTGTGLTGDGATTALGIDAAAAINFTNASAKSATSAVYANIAKGDHTDYNLGSTLDTMSNITAAIDTALESMVGYNGIERQIDGTTDYVSAFGLTNTAYSAVQYVTANSGKFVFSGSNISGDKQYGLTTAGWAEIDIPAVGGEYLPLSGGTVSGATYFSAVNGQNMLAVASAASLIGASRQTSANFGQNDSAMGTTWMGVGGPGMYRGFLKYTQGGNVGALDSNNTMQVEFTPTNKGAIFAKAKNNGTDCPETQILNPTKASCDAMVTSANANLVSGPNYMLAKNADGQFVIGAACINCTAISDVTLSANTYYFVYEV